MCVDRFQDDEAGYTTWLEAHPNGFVFNNFGGNDPRMNIVHRASCAYLRRPKDEGRRTIIEKVCVAKADLLTAVIRQVRGDKAGWRECRSCHPLSRENSLLEPKRQSSPRTDSPPNQNNPSNARISALHRPTSSSATQSVWGA
jgi:hypothetical protein